MNASNNVHFTAGKTYYLASTVTVSKDIELHGNGATIKTVTSSGTVVNNAIVISGTLKKTTTLTTDYTSNDNTDNCCNKFTLSDMTDIEIGDVMVIVATDQYYNYSRQYYYLGGTLLVTDIYDGHICTNSSMPWSITNTANVSVKIYDAPKVLIDNLNFESEVPTTFSYKYLLSLYYCKNSVISNCSFSQMDSGVKVHECVNTLIDNVSLSKSKYDNSLSADGYGIVIESCTETIIERVLTTCAQHAISVTGNEPSINTYIRNCNLTSECRNPGLDTHECTYNLVVEDCTLGTACLNGTVEMNRCRIINNRRASTETMGISAYGSHNSDWSRIRIANTKFDGTYINLLKSGVQSPIQTFDNVFGSIEFENCEGGYILFTPSTNETILSNTIKSLTLKNWKDCEKIVFDGENVIEQLSIVDTSFTNNYFITDNYASHGNILTNIQYLTYQSTYPQAKKMSVDKDTYGEKLLLPENTSIQLSSSNTSAKYVVCGRNLASDDPDDYLIGYVTGSAGGPLSRTVTTDRATVSTDADGNIVFTQPSNTTNHYSLYPVGMFYVNEHSVISMSATLINSGSTDPATFRPYIAVVDCDTGLLIERYSGTAVQATTSGASISYSVTAKKNAVAMCYFYCSGVVAGSETTFANMAVSVDSAFVPASTVSEAYTAKRLTGDGTILALSGINNIMCSEGTFHVTVKADYVNSPAGIYENAMGVNF